MVPLAPRAALWALIALVMFPALARSGGTPWPKAAPAEVGMDPALLAKARQYALTVGGSGYIIRHGRLVMAWGDATRRYDLKSTTKSIGVTALALALKDGRIKSLADKARAYHPTFGVAKDSNAAPGWLDRTTLFHLATQTAGFAKPGGTGKMLFAPGTKWSYSDSGPNWLAECITVVYQRDLADLLFERVFTPIGIKRSDLTWRNNAYRPRKIDGIVRREFGSGISANVDAMARIGTLYLRGGRWQDKQLIPREFVDAARVVPKAIRGLPVVDEKRYGKASNHYGLLWWNNADGTLRDVPRDAYWSWGLYDSLIVVIPSLDVVVARAGRSFKRGWGAHYDVLAPFLGPIAKSVRDRSTRRGVPLWGRFETRVANHKRYPNPFKDVVLDAAFTSPSGRTVEFLGYYDGDGAGGQTGTAWKLRFMPDEVGQWTYRCSFSDGTLGPSGSFVCVSRGAAPGPLRTRGRGFAFANGKSFYPRSYYFSEAFSAASPHWEKGIDRYFGGAFGYNFCCTTFWQGKLLARRKWNALPYNGFHPIHGSDYTRLDLASWKHVDEVVDRLAGRGAVWFNFDGFIPNVGGTMGSRRTDFDAQRVYARNVVARLAPCWNVVWNIAFEWHEFLSARQVRQLADYVKALDPWRHPVTVHDQGRYRSGKDVAAALHVDFVTLQHNAGTCGDAIAANRFVQSFRGDLPVFAQEVCWEGPHKLDGDQVRKGAWGVVLAGGFLNYAEQFDQRYGSGKAFPYVEILLDLVESLPHREMRPHNELVGAGQLCLASPGERYVCYAPAGGRIRLDLSSAGGSFDAAWLNPRTGRRTPAGVTQGGAPRTFRCPDARDWALCITRKGE